MNAIRMIRTTLFLACAAPLMLCAQQEKQGDLPRPNPGTSNPDLQPQHAPKNSQDTRSKDKEAGSTEGSARQASGDSSGKSSQKKSKKKHNPQGHGPQRHDPNGHS